MNVGKHNILGERIKSLRKTANLRQKELANKLNISHSSMSQYESGRRVPDDEIKIRIADFFKVSVDFLIGHDLCETKHNIVFRTLSDNQKSLLEVSEKLNDNDMDKVLEYAELLSIKTKRRKTS